MIVGVTTAPRDQLTIVRSLESIHRAGWEQQLIFAEPDSTVVEGVQFVVNESHVGPAMNWCGAVNTLKHQDDDYVLVFQDDVEVSRGARQYLETSWPDEADIVSLYCSRANHRQCISGFHPINDLPSARYGALAIAMRKHVVNAFGSNPLGVRKNDAALDIRLAKWADRCGFRMMTHSPSLVRHTGAVSTLGERDLSGNRQCAEFLEDTRMMACGAC